MNLFWQEQSSGKLFPSNFWRERARWLKMPETISMYLMRYTKRKCVFIKCETWMIKHTFKEIKEGLMLSTFAWELEGV